MDSVASVLDKYIDEYLAETETPFTKVEAYEMVEHILPIYDDDKKIVGMIGLSIFDSQALGEKVPVIKMIYIEKKARTPGSFKRVTKEVFTKLKEEGFKRVEIVTNRQINNWLKKKANSRPRQFAHLQTLDYLLENIGE
jgi:hypothetical protein